MINCKDFYNKNHSIQDSDLNIFLLNTFKCLFTLYKLPNTLVIISLQFIIVFVLIHTNLF